jgi:hypothetical protein
LDKHNELLRRIVEQLPKLLELQKRPFSSEDLIYRFYHQSFKVERVQDAVNQALEVFKDIAGDEYILNDWYLKIVSDGQVGKFQHDWNSNWLEKTRPQVEAFFHTKYFIDMLCKYGEELKDKEAPQFMPSGWAAITYLFEVRHVWK